MSEDTEKSARELGWVPKEEFRGDADKWRDAGTFLEEGQRVMPFLKKTNEGLRNDLTTQRTALAATQTALQESQETIKSLLEFQEETVKDRVTAARARLIEELKTAKKENDVDAEVEVTQELSRLDTAAANADQEAKDKKARDEAAAKGGNNGAQRDYRTDPEWQSWTKENEWFGTDQRRTRLVQVVAAEMRGNGDTRVGKAFLDAAAAEADKTLGRPAGGKVEDGGRHSGGGSGGSGGGGKSFADLPSDAKETVARQASRYVGDNKAFKDLKGWQEHYAKVYFAGEQ